MRIFIAALASLAFSGCVSFYQPIPENYDGPVSTIKSSATHYSQSKADLFYLSKLNGNQLYSSMNATRDATYGHGFRLITKLVDIDVPSVSSVFSIVGRTEYAAPIQALTGTVYQVKGDVQFLPEPDVSYVVKGKLGEQNSSVWIENESTGEIVGEKVEIEGDARLGFFEK